MNNQKYGELGENIAITYLLEKKYDILETNYRSKYGEIDIICKSDDTTIFVEVKRRSNLNKGKPSEAVTFNKQLHIIRTAYVYAAKKKIHETPMRFDIIAIHMDKVTHYENAFQVPLGFSFL